MIRVDYLVIGAGVAGVNAALAIRRVDPCGSIILVNGESALPYKRTKLSKHLSQGYNQDDFTLFPAEYYREQGIELLHDRVGVHKVWEHTVHGRRDYQYRKLVLACGAGYAMPPRWQSSRTFSLREMADGLELQRLARTVRRITVLGAGVEGLELASSYASSHRVVLVEQGFSPLPRLASKVIQHRLVAAARYAGVDCRFGETVGRVVQTSEELCLKCQRKGALETDLLLLATGTRPSTPLLPRIPGQAVGRVDSRLRWSDDVYVAGDLCYFQGRRCLLWHEAESLGQAAGRNAALALLGREEEAYRPKLYRTKLECFGLYLFLAQPTVLPHCSYEYSREGRYYHAWFDENRLMGANMLGDEPKAKLLQSLIWEGASLEEVAMRLDWDRGSLRMYQ